MSYVRTDETAIFVTYEITPLKGHFKNSLYQHLFDNVWGERREAEEDIRVVCDKTTNNLITGIRYQFGSDFDADEAKKVGELIDKQIRVWIAKNNIADVVEA